MKPSEDEADAEGGDDGLRSVWRAMRDEEPPARGLDALMAAAGAKADEMRKAPTREIDALMAAAERRAPKLADGTRPPDEERAAVKKPAPVPVVPPPRPAWWRRPTVLAFASVVILVGGVLVVADRADAPPAADRADAPPAATSTPAPIAPPSPVQTTPAPDRLREREPAPPAAIERTESRVPAGPPANAAAPKKAAAPALMRDAEAAAARGDCAQARRLIAKIFGGEAGPRARAWKNTALAKCMDE